MRGRRARGRAGRSSTLLVAAIVLGLTSAPGSLVAQEALPPDPLDAEAIPPDPFEEAERVHRLRAERRRSDVRREAAREAARADRWHRESRRDDCRAVLGRDLVAGATIVFEDRVGQRRSRIDYIDLEQCVLVIDDDVGGARAIYPEQVVAVLDPRRDTVERHRERRR